MALQSEVSLPMVGDTNKDTKIDGDTKSDDNDTSQSTEDEVDLEEGEILDSGEEEEDPKENTQSQLKEALDIKCLKTIEKLAASPAKAVPHIENNAVKPQRLPKKLYLDHDRIDDNEEDNAWFPPSPKFKTSSKFSDGPIDYRKELAAYMGSPPSSPERKKHKDDKKRKKKSKSSKSSKLRKSMKRKDKNGARITRKVEKRLCKFYKDGKCSKGSDCQFAHLGPTRKRELCKFYISNSCFKGKSCTYMHEEFPCKFYHTGSRCFADENCRYSHAPLTDETKQLLADYLGGHHGNDDFDNRKRHRSSSPEQPPPSPVPVKRPCILGSPPRHIKEAEETKRWQEEMKLLQQQNQPGFEIHLGHDTNGPFPIPDDHFSRPNFYAETLHNSPSPQRSFGHARPISPDPRHRIHPPHGFPEMNDVHMPPHTNMHSEGDVNVNWGNINNIIQSLSGPQDMPQETAIKQEPDDFTNDVKFDETTQFSGEVGSPLNFPPAISPNHMTAEDDENDNEDYEEGCANEDDYDDDSNNGETLNHGSPNRDTVEESLKPLPPPIVIPNHLPRKQRELFLRIQQHQRRNSTVLSNASDSPDAKSENPDVERDENFGELVENTVEKEPSKWYSSEDDDDDDDDDDDTDRPLTNVLKKLREEPLKQTQAKPSINLIQMLTKITHPNDISQPLAETQHSQGAFWESILTGAVPPNPVPAPLPVASNLLSKRRTLLPNPKLLPPPVEKIEAVVPKDPRLKNRDPRTLAASISNASTVAAKVSTPNINVSPMLPQVPIPSSPQPKTNDIIKLFTKPETPKEIPYKLHGIFTKPPNYMPYIHASQSDPKLLNDPRLRRHILQVIPGSEPNDNSSDIPKEFNIGKAPVKEAPPPIPPLLLQYGKPDGKLSINIFETNTSSKASIAVPKLVEPKLVTAARRLSDPRIRTRDLLTDQLSSSSSNTPPHLSISDPRMTPPRLQDFKQAPFLENALLETKSETKWLPPVLEKNWLPPVLERNSSADMDIKQEISSPPQLVIQEVPDSNPLTEQTLDVKKSDNSLHPVIKKNASHLPRAIADPRMAKLHNPLDPRRRMVSADVSAKSTLKSLVSVKTEPTDITVAAKTESIDMITTIKTEPTDDGITIPCQPELTVEQITAQKMSTEEEVTVKTEPVASEIKLLTKPPAEETRIEIDQEALDFSEKLVAASSESEVAKIAEEICPKKKTSSIPKKKKSSSEKSDEKKKTIYRNRKSSMDYASPLNSYDDANSTNAIGYNTYNQRLRQRTPKQVSSGLPTQSPANTPVSGSISEFMLSDNSNQECDSNDVNLKDMFKTIDPTASPFC